MEIETALGIRYVKLHFLLEFTGAYSLPVNKASALRGGIGEMLLNANCVMDRNCDACAFRSECLVQRIMYSRMEIQPAFMSQGDSVGYVFECEDYRDRVFEGERLEFRLILFGKSIVYFSQYLNALYALGQTRLGKDGARFRIVSVTNTVGEEILEGNSVRMDRYKVHTLASYVRYRVESIKTETRKASKGLMNSDRPMVPEGLMNSDGSTVPEGLMNSDGSRVLEGLMNSDPSGCKEGNGGLYTLRFRSPLALKYRGEFLNDFHMEALLEGICRRIYMLDCFEGIESEPKAMMPEVIPRLISQGVRKARVRRYSTRRDSAMLMSGIEGEALVSNVGKEALALLLAGELIHIGKNTSFGFGRFRVKACQNSLPPFPD